MMAPPATESRYPHLQPLPTRGRGAHRVRGAKMVQIRTSVLERQLFLRGRFRSLIERGEPERSERRSVRFLVEELPQAGIAGVLLVGHSDRLTLLGEEIVRLRDVHA